MRKAAVIEMMPVYTIAPQAKNIKVQGRTAWHCLPGVNGMKMGRYISDHDMKNCQRLPMWCAVEIHIPKVSEQYLLDLERETFVSLCGEKNIKRIQSILTGGKPLRN